MSNDTLEISEQAEQQIIVAILKALADGGFDPFQKFDVLVMVLMAELSAHTADEIVLRVAVDAVHEKMLAHVGMFAHLQACRRSGRLAYLQ